MQACIDGEWPASVVEDAFARLQSFLVLVTRNDQSTLAITCEFYGDAVKRQQALV